MLNEKSLAALRAVKVGSQPAAPAPAKADKAAKKVAARAAHEAARAAKEARWAVAEEARVEPTLSLRERNQRAREAERVARMEEAAMIAAESQKAMEAFWATLPPLETVVDGLCTREGARLIDGGQSVEVLDGGDIVQIDLGGLERAPSPDVTEVRGFFARISVPGFPGWLAPGKRESYAEWAARLEDEAHFEETVLETARFHEADSRRRSEEAQAAEALRWDIIRNGRERYRD